MTTRTAKGAGPAKLEASLPVGWAKPKTRCWGRGTRNGTRQCPARVLSRTAKTSGCVAEFVGRIAGKAAPGGRIGKRDCSKGHAGAGDSGTPSPNPWDLSLSRQNIGSTMKELERRIGLRRDATRAPIQGPEWQGAGFQSRPQKLKPKTPASSSLITAKDGLDHGVHFTPAKKNS